MKTICLLKGRSWDSAHTRHRQVVRFHNASCGCDRSCSLGRVTDFRVEGWVWRPMYDDHPYEAAYASESLRRISAPHPLTLSQAMAFAVEVWSRCLCEERDDDAHAFHASAVVLLDEQSNPVQRAIASPDCRRLLTWSVLPPAAEWSALAARAQSLYEEAAFEGGWDNYATAQRLRNQASQLELLVTMARHNPMVLR
jgi:hypothetical protein